jgi:uncharacterized protein YprB with RNaseH-like and TPR domain
LFNQNIGINQLMESQEMICFACKWLGEEEVFFYSAHHDGKAVMVQKAWDFLNEADAVLHYNGKGYDIPHLNREFLLAGMTPPAPFAQIDLYLAVKKRFRFTSNKLDYVSQAMGFEGKVQHEGHWLWVKCMAGDVEAWEKMQEYNQQDVVLLEQMYEKLLPWIPGHPNRALIDNDPYACPKCGGRNFAPQGWAYTALSQFERSLCVKCGAWVRKAKRVDSVDQREVNW